MAQGGQIVARQSFDAVSDFHRNLPAPHTCCGTRRSGSMSSPDNMRDNDPPIRGRPFAPGNSGRPPGSKNRSTVVYQALLEGEEEDLVRKAIELAKAGDVAMLKFLLARLLPRERPVKLDLPRMDYADDAVDAFSSIADAVSKGQISPSEGASLATLINHYARAIDVADLVRRVDDLEEKLKGDFQT